MQPEQEEEAATKSWTVAAASHDDDVTICGGNLTQRQGFEREVWRTDVLEGRRSDSNYVKGMSSPSSCFPSSQAPRLPNIGAVCGELPLSAARPMADRNGTPEQDEPVPISDNTNSRSTEFDDMYAFSDDPVDEFARDLHEELAKDSPGEFENDLDTDVTPEYSPEPQDEPGRPFLGLGENQGRMMQEIRHRMRDMERRLQDRLARKNRRMRSESRERSRTSSRTRRKSRSPQRRAEDRGHVIMGRTPFVAAIRRSRLPKNFDKPTDLKYDGTTDPQDHLDAFEARINLERGVAFKDLQTFRRNSYPILPQAEPRQNTRYPYLGLSKGLVNQFESISTGSIKAVANVDPWNQGVLSYTFVAGLAEGDFRRHLTTKDVKTMEEIQKVALKYMRDEDVRKVVSSKRKTPTGTPQKVANTGNQVNLLRSPISKGEKFSSYTLLKGTISEIYHQISHRGILPKPWQIKARANANKAHFCDYHKVHGH
ncbi:hypothetical protein PIB30_017653 [Stylosanthes scabra]|uniref:Uncharacterized protein n=1 Tax=Stylosanthes scabra TaxID=79078 RepID=A0ABU6X5N5_9FABA|nr:hypothetical protein [Stylosanthes scabra]